MYRSIAGKHAFLGAIILLAALPGAGSAQIPADRQAQHAASRSGHASPHPPTRSGVVPPAGGTVAGPRSAMAAATGLEPGDRGGMAAAIAAAGLVLISGDDGGGNAGAAGAGTTGSQAPVGLVGTTGTTGSN